MRKSEKITALYERLSRDDFGKDDDQQRESNSISNQKAMLTMIAAINEFERQNLLDRQREGIAIAKRNGIYKGRKKVAVPDNFPELYARYTRREMNKGQLAEALHVTRPTLERMIREHLATVTQI